MEDFAKSKNKILLILLSISAFFSSLNQNIYSPIIPLIRDTFDTTIFWVNLTVSGFIFITAVMQIILGTFIDHANQLLFQLLFVHLQQILSCFLFHECFKQSEQE